MPLIELKTNLKSLKYGLDQPGGGYSGQPYIQTGIPADPLIIRNPTIQGLRGEFLPIFRPGSTGNLDYPIRGGQIDFQLGDQTYTLSSQIDRIRIKKFFDNKPRGTAFIQKQVGLQLSNPKTETGNTLYGLGQADPLPGLIENTRVYNKGINTLAQVATSGTGAHAIRHGLIPFNPWQKHYYAIVNQQNIENNTSNNRLLVLSDLKMTSPSTRLKDIVSTQNVTNMNLVNTLGISLNRNFMFQYWGGPGSVYGVGTTTIRRVVDTTRLKSTTTMTYDLLRKQKSNFNNPIPTIQDFRDQISGSFSKSYIKWGNNEINNRFYIQDAGKYKDKMNSLYPFGFDNNIAPWEFDKSKTDDLIKFVFEAISNDNTSTSTAIFFRAFLTAGITDNNSAQLNSFKYIGRGEDFFTYQGFSRTISFSFRVAAQSKEDLKPMYNRINTLMSQVYPDYSPNQQIMRAPIVKVTIGDYLVRVPGFLESVNLTIDNNTPWEINLNKEKDLAQLPQVVDISVSFRPIMDILPRRSGYTSELKTENKSNTQDIGEVTTTDTFREASSVPLIANIKDSNFIVDLKEKSRIRTSVSITPPPPLPPSDSLTPEEESSLDNLDRQIYGI